MSGETFAERHCMLISGELAKCRGDNDRKAAIIETLARALGLAIAVCCEGDSETIDTMMTGAEAYAHSEAVEKAPFARMMAEMRT